MNWLFMTHMNAMLMSHVNAKCVTHVRWYPTPNLFFKNKEEPQQTNRPFLTNALRSAKISASSIKWVVSRITFPACLSFNIDHIWRLDAGSIPAVGSSKNITLGFPISAIASDSFRFCPPLSSVETMSPWSAKLTSLKLFSISASMYFSPTPLMMP